MKHLIYYILSITFLQSCTNSNVSVQEPQKNNQSQHPDYEKGLALVTSNNCFSCHKVDEKLTGPSYKEIAKKYANTPENVKILAQKIIKGGQGVWGAMVMIPQPNITKEDAEQMVKYILSLKE